MKELPRRNCNFMCHTQIQSCVHVSRKTKKNAKRARNAKYDGNQIHQLNHVAPSYVVKNSHIQQMKLLVRLLVLGFIEIFMIVGCCCSTMLLFIAKKFLFAVLFSVKIFSKMYHRWFFDYFWFRWSSHSRIAGSSSSMIYWMLRKYQFICNIRDEFFAILIPIDFMLSLRFGAIESILII